MVNINDDIELIGTTALRTNMPKIGKDLKVKTVIIMKRGKPIAILEDFEKYQQKEKMIETFEDMVLGYQAKERYEQATSKDYINEAEVMRKVGLSR